jgi:hypothetical protein
MPIIFKPDWSVNVANIATVIVAIMGGVGAWYDVKSDTRMNSRDIASLQMEQSQIRQDVKAENNKQDAHEAAVVLDLKGVMKDNKDEIKADIRDLRNDLFRKGH